MSSGSGDVTLEGDEIATASGGDVGAIAAANFTASGKRFVYVTYVNKVQRITISEDNTLSLNDVVTSSTSGFGSVEFASAEADLSHDGSKLAWAGLDNNKAYIISLDPKAGTYVASSLSTTTYGTDPGYQGRGVEFNADGSKLYATGPSGVYQVTGTGANTGTIITGTGSYGNSQLEMGSSGQIYALSSTHIIGIITSGNTLSTAVSLSQIPYVNTTNIRTLPDQIDGYNYGTQPSASFTSTSYTATTTATWTTGSNPFGVSSPKIKTSLTIPSGKTITITGMVFEFGSGATVNVQSGGTLILNNTTFQAACPITMWQGVVVTGTGVFTMDDVSNNGSEIYDAIRGIDASGTSAVITVKDYSIFNKNERSIFISNGSTTNAITKSTFNNTTALIDQSKGLDQSGGTTNTRYGIASIQIEGSTNTQIVGSTTAGLGNTFNDGQYGIYGYNSNIASLQNTFNDLRTRGIVLDGAWTGKNLSVTNGNVFNDCKTAIDGHYGVNLTVQANTFDDGYEHGIVWTYNGGSDLLIGHETNAALGNTFTNQSWGAIVATDNGSTSTDMVIGSNDITDANYAGGIYVQETNSPASRTHNKIRIVKNNLNDLGDGVTVTNVWGYTGDEAAQTNADPTSSTFKISNNDIDFSTAYGSSKKGIHVANSRYMRARFNNVATTSYGTWGNNAIDFGDSRYSLVEKNYVKGATGINLGLDNLHSNIDCNDIVNCVVGIDLGYHTLRTGPTDYHGTYAPPVIVDMANYFTSSSTYDMRVYYSNPDNNKWVYPNTTNINYDHPTNGNTISVGASGSNACGGLDAYESIIGGGEETYKTDEGGEEAVSNPFWFQDMESETWTFAYHEQAEHIAASDGVVITDNTFIPSVISLEQLLSNADFAAAREVWATLTPVHAFEQNLVDVYDVVLSYRPEEPRALTDAETAVLVSVAEQSPREAGPAVYSARAVLKLKLNMDFYDEVAAPGDREESFKMLAENDARFAVYPVPAKHNITLLSGVDGVTYFKIVSLEGRLVAQGNFTTRSEFNMNNLSVGAYYLEMTNEQGEAVYHRLITKE